MRLVLFRIVCLILVAIATLSCFHQQSDYDSNLYYIYPKYAKGFYITTNIDSQKDPFVGFTLVIRDPSDTTHIISKIKLEKCSIRSDNTVACFSTTHLAFCRILGSLNNVVGIPDSSFYKDTDILRDLQKNDVKEITMAEGTKMEVILKLRPSYLFISEYQNIDLSTLESAGIKVIPTLEYLETDPLGRMEWVRLFGFLLSKDSLSTSLSESVSSRYENLSHTNKAIGSRPKIIDVNEYHGYWYASGGKSYMSALYNDAGYEYVFNSDNHNGSFPLSQEAAIKSGMETEYWRFVADCSKNTIVDRRLIESQNDYYRHFKATKEGKIVACNPLSSGYYIEGVLEPDVVLKDLIFARGGFNDSLYNPTYYFICK